MRLNLDWNKDFQEFQDILNSGIHPEWLYCAKANLVLEPAYTGEGKQFFSTQDIIKASKIIPFFKNLESLHKSNESLMESFIALLINDSIS